MVYVFLKTKHLSLAGVKRRDVIKCMVKISQLDFLITASQKGTLTVFTSQVILKQLPFFFIVVTFPNMNKNVQMFLPPLTTIFADLQLGLSNRHQAIMVAADRVIK